MANKNKDIEVSPKVIKKVEGDINKIINFVRSVNPDIYNGGKESYLSGSTGPYINSNKNEAFSTQFKFEHLEDGMKKISGLFKQFDTAHVDIETDDFTDGKHFEAIIDEFGKIVTTSIEGQKKKTKMYNVDNYGLISKVDASIKTTFNPQTNSFQKEISQIPQQVKKGLQEIQTQGENKKENIQKMIQSQFATANEANGKLSFLEKGIGTVAHSAFNLNMDTSGFVKQIDKIFDDLNDFIVMSDFWDKWCHDQDYRNDHWYSGKQKEEAENFGIKKQLI